jgi:hypothetical protein
MAEPAICCNHGTWWTIRGMDSVSGVHEGVEEGNVAPSQTSVEGGGEQVFSHPRSYINEDGGLSIWVGRPPGYEFLDEGYVEPASVTLSTADPQLTGNRAERRAGAGSARTHQLSTIKPNAPHINSHVIGRRHSRGR